MECHESLMQRRRKRNRAAAANRKQPAGIKLDKSLPSLPPEESEALAAARPVEDPAADAYADATTEVASHGAAPALDSGRSDHNLTPRLPPNQDNLILPSSTYRSNRNSTITRDQPEPDAGEGEFLIPLAFDPSEGKQPSRAPPPPPPHGSSESSPHIAYQEKGRDRTVLEPVRYRQEEPVAGAANRSSVQRSHHHPHASDGFKAQDSATKPVARSGSVRSSRSDLVGHTREASSFSTPSPESARSSTQPTRDTSTVDSQRSTALDTTTTSIPSRPSHELRKLHENTSVDSAKSLPASNNMQYPPKRGDSLESRLHQLPRKDFGTSPRPPSMSMSQIGEGPGRPIPPPSQDGTPSSHRPSASKGTTPKLGESPRTQRSDSHPEPPRHGRQASAVQSDTGRPADNSASPSLLRYSVGGGGDFSMDEDMQRIMGLDDTQMAQHESFLRRMSNSVRHGRSFSDKGARLSRDTKRPRTPVNGFTPTQDPPTPSAGSPEIRSDEVAFLRGELRKERQRTLEREQKIAELEGALNATADVKLANTELSEKRSTMVVLDAKKEIVMRELSVLTDYLEAEKRGTGGGQLDLGKITNHVLREFVESIQKLKDSFTPQIEELVQKRSETSEEIANLNRLKEKNFQEFEQLSSKNAQLAELNNQLVHQIQELYKANSVEGNRNANGLGIYSHGKDKSMSDAMKAAAEITQPVSTTNISEDAEPATIVPGPQVVSIRKGQPRKFNWKKGGQNVAKGVTKGLKGAFMSSESAGQEVGPGIPRSQTHDPTRQGFGFFGNQKKQVGGKMAHADTAPALSDPPGMFPLSFTIRGAIVC